jgi:hypothetical protein
MPTGNSSFVKPAGREAAGCKVKLNGYVKGIQPTIGVTNSPAISSTPPQIENRASCNEAVRDEMPGCQKGL